MLAEHKIRLNHNDYHNKGLGQCRIAPDMDISNRRIKSRHVLRRDEIKRREPPNRFSKLGVKEAFCQY